MGDTAREFEVEEKTRRRYLRKSLVAKEFGLVV
jgi:hypothetical protein